MGQRITKTCFSQWYPASFTVEERDYNCAEQYMMAQKAKLFGDMDIFYQILQTSDPRKIKNLGRMVRNFDSTLWNQHKFGIVVQGNVAKFSQNKELEEFLISTGDKILVEASPYDKVWGVGLNDRSVDILNPSKWKGSNLLGFALMTVRDLLNKQNTHEA